MRAQYFRGGKARYTGPYNHYVMLRLAHDDILLLIVLDYTAYNVWLSVR
jgi:hypothetical protein